MSEPMSPERRAEIEALVDEATEGPWHTAAEAGELGFGYGETFVANWEGEYLRGVGDVDTGDGEQAEADLRLILEAPCALRELLAEVRRLQAERDRAVELIESSAEAFLVSASANMRAALTLLRSGGTR